MVVSNKVKHSLLNAMVGFFCKNIFIEENKYNIF